MGNHEQVSKDLRTSCSRRLVNAFHPAMLTSVGVKKPAITNQQSCHAAAPKSKHAEVWQLLLFRSFYYIVQASLHRDIDVSMLYRNKQNTKPSHHKEKREEGPTDRRHLVALGRKLGNAFHQAMLSLVGVYQETFLILIGWLDTNYNSRIK